MTRSTFCSIAAGVVLSVTAVAPPALAQQAVYRCSGNHYSHEPCPGGARIATADPRSDEQKAMADEVNRRSGAAAAELERQRLREQDATRIRASGPPTGRPQAAQQTARQRPVPPSARQRKGARQAAADSGLFTVTDGNGVPRKKKKKPQEPR